MCEHIDVFCYIDYHFLLYFLTFMQVKKMSTLPSTRGADGRPLLTVHIQQALARLYPFRKPTNMATFPPNLAVNGLSPISPTSEDENPGKNARKLTLLRKIRPPPFKYAWNFYHDRHATDGDYEGRLTLMLDNIVTVKPFWEAFNQFPLAALQLKDSVHFFKRGVKPVWEDPRNVKGGSWTFRVQKAQAEEFWKEVLMMAVGEQFADVIQPGKLLFVSSLRRLVAYE